MSELFFNARDWRRIGCSEQQIKFIEGLLERAGGSTEPTQDLTNLNAYVATLATAINAVENAVDALEVTVSSLELSQTATTTTEITEVVDDVRQNLNLVNSEVHRLSLRINQVEDTL